MNHLNDLNLLKNGNTTPIRDEPLLILEEKNCGKTFTKALFEFGKGIFQGVTPDLINMAPAHLSKMTNLKIFSISGLLKRTYGQVKPHENWLETGVAGVLIAANMIKIADALEWLPIEAEHRVAIDSLLLLANLIGTSRHVYNGTKKILFSIISEKTDTSSKVSNFVSGGISLYLGATTLKNFVPKNENNEEELEDKNLTTVFSSTHIITVKTNSSLKTDYPTDTDKIQCTYPKDPVVCDANFPAFLIKTEEPVRNMTDC